MRPERVGIRASALVAAATTCGLVFSACTAAQEDAAETAPSISPSSTMCIAASETANRDIAESFHAALVDAASGSQAKVADIVEGETAKDAIKRAIATKCGVIATLSPSMAAAASEAASANPSIVFQVNGIQPSSKLPRNLVPLNLGFDAAGFLAGYAAAATTRSGILGVMTASTADSVVSQGFAQGVDFYNQSHGTGIVVQGWNAASRQATSVTSANEVSSHVGTYLAQGADIILVAAESYSQAAVDAVHEAESDASLIFVGSDYAETVPPSRDVVMTSLVAEPDKLAGTMLGFVTSNAIHNNADIGFTKHIPSAHLADFRDFRVRLSEDVTAKLDELKDQLAKGDIRLGKEDK